MLKPTVNPIDLIETQIELFENLNRRLEELDTWRERFPAHAARITETHDDGIHLGVQVKAMEDFSDKVEEVNRQYHAFVHKYEDLWLAIQNSPSPK